MGGQLATGRRRDPDRLHVFHIDPVGNLRCAAQDAEAAGGWDSPALPQADGLPFGTDMHPAGALATGYQAQGRTLNVFTVDRDGMLRVYSAVGNRAWQADVIPDAVGIPPGACLATGYRRGGVLDVFTVSRAGEPLVFSAPEDGRWRAEQLPLDSALPHGANLATGYLGPGSALTLFAIDRAGHLRCVSHSSAGVWRAEPLDARPPGALRLPPGAPLSIGYPGGGERISVFTVDGGGLLRELRADRHGWQSRTLPGPGLAAPAALATAYLDGGRRLVVFVVDEAGRLRRYAHGPGDGWTVGTVPNATGLPPGAALATGYRDAGKLLDVFVMSQFTDPPLRYTAQDGGWTGPHAI